MGQVFIQIPTDIEAEYHIDDPQTIEALMNVLRTVEAKSLKTTNPVLGLFADVPELMDEIVEEALHDRFYKKIN